MSTECKDCKFREGNCGNHFISVRNGSTNYDIPSLSACDKYGNCMFFKPKEKLQGDLISREALRKAINNAYKECDGYDPNDLMRFAERVDTEIDNAPTVTDNSRELDIYDIAYNLGRKVGCFEGKIENKRPQGENKEALFVLNHLFYDCDNMTKKEYDILLEAIKEADNEMSI